MIVDVAAHAKVRDLQDAVVAKGRVQDVLGLDVQVQDAALVQSAEAAADVARGLTQHRDFDWKNPNRFRSVIGALATNAAGFHDGTGASYDLVADWLIRLDPVNPQTAARMTTVFETWRRYDADRQDLIRAALQRVGSTPDLSRDTGEMVGRILGD